MERKRKLYVGKAVVVLAAIPFVIWAYETGPDAGYNGVPGEHASCIASGCHTGTLNTSGGGVKVAFPNGNSYSPGVKQHLTVTISDPAASQTAWGFQLTARVEGSPSKQAGTFASTDQFTGLECASASNIQNQSPVLNLPNQTCPASMTLQYIEHNTNGYRHNLGQTGSAGYEFDWTPPATSVGNIVIYVAGNAGPGGPPTQNNAHVYTATYTLTPASSGPTPSITSVENGASFQPGIEAGSWVTIKGSNLANIPDPGRIWRADEIVNGKLPTSLDGVSVTINGNPASVYFISQGQINVQAPDDSAQGPVNVVVNNNGLASPPATAQLQPYAPALFQWTNTSYAIVTRIPDYALIGNPASVQGTIAAKPGDLLTLWATGFGPSNPPTLAGQVVTTGAPLMSPPSITVGGTKVTMLGTAMSPGSAGLYQIAIQLPDSIALGDQEIVASVGGFQSASGVKLFIAKQ
jgi:uncharacterized protein (TIGR03437 family)